jgi:hypothetical protein
VVEKSTSYLFTQILALKRKIAALSLGGGGAWGTITGTLSDQTDLQSALDAKAGLASPTFTGTPAAPTAAGGTNTTQLATTAFVQQEIGTLISAAPGVLDTLDELAAALGDDPNFATTMTTFLAGKQATLVSGTNIKTINGSSILGAGNLVVSGSGPSIGLAVTLSFRSPIY